ncbi:MAG: hypothetical protein ACYCZI_00630 [Metallibacterium scheffleri]|uniref:hypothetical protein n=1 Tax=Metallibacterium scheffleri TaxID=993689 RepID=UPI0023F0746A|nr:hypothetical protein [Metallibacterium scheffleri]
MNKPASMPPTASITASGISNQHVRTDQEIRRDGTASLCATQLAIERKVCNKPIWLDRGKLMAMGSTAEVTEAHVAHN